MARVIAHSSAVLIDRIMAIILSTIASVVGVYAVMETAHDVLWARSSVLYSVARFQTGYFIIDLFVMYEEIKLTYSGRGTTLMSLMKLFLRKQLIFIIHHLVMVYLCLVVLEYSFRGGRGDFIVALLCVSDMSTPFQATYFIHRQIGSEDQQTMCFRINGALFIVIYLFCRVLVIPLFYILYSHQYHSNNLWNAMVTMTWICHLCCALTFIFNFYFFIMALSKVAKKTLLVKKKQQ